LLKQLLSGGAWAFGGKLGASLAGLVVNSLLARLLSPEEVGSYFLIVSIVSLAAVLANLGLSQAIVRLVAESIGAGYHGRARRAIHLSLLIALVGALIAGCFLAFGGGAWIATEVFHSTLIAQLTGLVALLAVAMTFQTLIAEAFRGLHDIRLATIFGGLISTLLSMLLFAGVWVSRGHSNLGQIIYLSLAAGVLSTLMSAIVLRWKIRELPDEPDAINLKDVLTISWPLWITTLTFFAVTQADLWVLGSFRSQEEVAIYGAVKRLVALVTTPLLIVNAVVPPIIAEMNSQGRVQELELVLRRTATFAGLPALVFLGAFVLFGSRALNIVFGEFYRDGSSMLTILSLGAFINVWAGSCGLVLRLTGHQYALMVITLLCGSVTAAGALFTVDRFGGLGVAIAVAVGMSLQNLMMLIVAKQKAGIWTHMGFSLNPSLDLPSSKLDG
jgi:O-antigen/teichoic acid export membrane protein